MLCHPVAVVVVVVVVVVAAAAAVAVAVVVNAMNAADAADADADANAAHSTVHSECCTRPETATGPRLPSSGFSPTRAKLSRQAAYCLTAASTSTAQHTTAYPLTAHENEYPQTTHCGFSYSNS